MHKDSQKWQILIYMQNNPTSKVTGLLFMTPEREDVPFIWYSANTRICDLLREWLIDVCEEKIEGKKTFHKKARDRNLYIINKKWLIYNFWKPCEENDQINQKLQEKILLKDES